MKKNVLNYDELPLPNKKIYDLVTEKSGGNVSAFANLIRVKQQSVDRLFKIDSRNGKYPTVSPDIKKALKDNFDIDEVWLLTGEGTMLSGDVSVTEQEAVKSKGNDSGYKLVPLISPDSVGGMHSDNDSVDEVQYTISLIPFRGAEEGDVCIHESGYSMIPTIPPGSVILLRQVCEWRSFFWFGGIFVIELSDGRRITKEVRRSDTDPERNVLCHSHNENVPDEELPKDMIVSVWKVMKILINRGF